MFTKYVLPLIAAAGLGFAIFTVVKARQTPPISQPLKEPPQSPVGFSTLNGAGLVEAEKENIPIGTNVPGVVVEVFVKIGDKVDVGTPLFRIDDRDLRAELAVRKAALESALAQLHKLEAAPRPEDVPPLQAALDEALARYESAKYSATRTKNLYERGIAPIQDWDNDRFLEAAASAAVEKAKADLDRMKAGTWKEDLIVSRAAVDQARAQVESIQVGIDRLTVRALARGEVLQVHVRPGQYAAVAWNEPLIVLGDVETLHVRVDIDENDLARFQSSRPATARLRGIPDTEFELAWVKTEPYVIPKKSLTGDNSERVDTRVLQVIYRLVNMPIKVYVGQQMDVFIKLEESGATPSETTAAPTKTAAAR
ncbi:MAG: efflux RND transporter periplasmic adaptor subunit [Isosphaeraceae bacterium]|nr:efflux RND transporter periplasmic adaptor subunit [Isosphaeraceae bacterium]